MQQPSFSNHGRLTCVYLGVEDASVAPDFASVTTVHQRGRHAVKTPVLSYQLLLMVMMMTMMMMAPLSSSFSTQDSSTRRSSCRLTVEESRRSPDSTSSLMYCSCIHSTLQCLSRRRHCQSCVRRYQATCSANLLLCIGVEWNQSKRKCSLGHWSGHHGHQQLPPV